MKIDKSKFANKKELIDYVVNNKVDLIDVAKSVVKQCDTIRSIVSKKEDTNKAKPNENTTGILNKTIVGNTYGWMDSHDDVHIPSIFTKSIQEAKRTFHFHDHEQMVAAQVGKFKKVYEAKVKWKDLGINKEGEADCLLGNTDILKVYNAAIFDMYLNNEIDQHSVGMIYVNLFLCANDPEYKEEFANWLQYMPYVKNPEKAIENGYFWAVTEAKLKEISCVIAGSNELTPTLEPSNDTLDKTEPLQSTRKELDYKYLVDNY